jgi:hypothetical protein
MTFDEGLARIRELLQQQKRVSYRGLKRRFELDDESIEDLKEELIGALQLASDEEGRFLVWAGAPPVQDFTFQVSSPPQSLAPPPQPPIAYTPPHLAERRFTEGFDTKDLQEAKVLITELSH